MEQQDAPLLVDAPHNKKKMASHREAEQLRFIFGVVVLFTAMHGGSLILDWVYDRPPHWLDELIKAEDSDGPPSSNWVIYYMRIFMAYSFVLSWSWTAVLQYWLDVPPTGHRRPARGMMPREKRRYYTNVVFVFYLLVCEGAWRVILSTAYWVKYGLLRTTPDAVDFGRAVRSTAGTASTYLAVYYSAWFVMGIPYHPARGGERDSDE